MFLGLSLWARHWEGAHLGPKPWFVSFCSDLVNPDALPCDCRQCSGVPEYLTTSFQDASYTMNTMGNPLGLDLERYCMHSYLNVVGPKCMPKKQIIQFKDHVLGHLLVARGWMPLPDEIQINRTLLHPSCQHPAHQIQIYGSYHLCAQARGFHWIPLRWKDRARNTAFCDRNAAKCAIRSTAA